MAISDYVQVTIQASRGIAMDAFRWQHFCNMWGIIAYYMQIVPFMA